MGDPTGLLGAAVGEALHRVIEAAEKAVEWPQYCAELKQLLESVGPLVDEVTSQEIQDGANGSSAINSILRDLKNCLDDAETVLTQCANPKIRLNPLARFKSASKLAETTARIKDLLSTRMGLLTFATVRNLKVQIAQPMATLGVAERLLRQEIAELSLGLEAQRFMMSEERNKDRAFYALKRGVDRLSTVTSSPPTEYSHVGSSASSSSIATTNTIGSDNETFEAQPLPQFVFGLDELSKQLQELLLRSEKNADYNEGDGNAKQSHGSKFVGVWAQGGAGKTLLVQTVMNNPIVQAHFNSSVYFLEVGRSPDVVRLQNKLCDKVDRLKFGPSFESPSEGKTKLLNLLRGRKCLLILDDVWEGELLEWFDAVSEAGSCVLITTRNQTVLEKVHATQLRVHMLSEDNSLKLLCAYAFCGEERMPEHLVKLVKCVVAECKGLPLSLKLIGGALAERVESHHWEMALQKLRDAEALSPQYEEQLFHRLKLSYDDLDRTSEGKICKECFLYFAAFPEDEVIEADHLLQLWAGEGLIGQHENRDPDTEGYCILGVLIGRSLIEFEKVWSRDQSLYVLGCKIHDVLRDMGLYILQNGMKTWEQRCLFKAGWQPRDHEVLPQGWLSASVGGDGGPRHKNNCNIMQARKLSLMGSRLSSLPSKVGVKGPAPPLQVLLLGRSHELSNLGGAFLGRFTNLRVLDASNTSIRSLPKALGKLKELVVLALQQSTMLESLPQEIGKLTKLEYLNLQHCRALRSLPVKSLAKLVRLKYLNTRGCSGAWDKAANEEPGSTLHIIKKCFGVVASPQSMSSVSSHLEALCSMVNLRKLWIGSLNQEVLPGKVIGGLVRLRLLSVYFSRLKELPEEMRKLEELEILDLNTCCALTELPDWVPECMTLLQTLDLRGCWMLSQVPGSLSSLQNLTKLELSDCRALQRLPNDFGRSGAFPSLQELWLFACTHLEAFPDLEPGAFPRLSILNLFDCSALKSLPESFKYLGPRLRNLNLGGCWQLAMPSDATLAAFIKLEELVLKGLPVSILPVAVMSLPALTKLDISSCSKLVFLPEHSTSANLYFPKLQELIARNVTSLTDIPVSIIELPQLKRLDVTGCDSVVVTEDMQKAIGNRKDMLIKGLQMG